MSVRSSRMVTGRVAYRNGVGDDLADQQLDGVAEFIEAPVLQCAPGQSAGAAGGGVLRLEEPDTYARFVDALELHFRELHRAADYAGLLGCSVRTLSRAARDTTGKGVREVIDERWLLEARRLLRGGGWDARAVAVHLGFTDPANFGRFFRGHTGLTPAAFTARETRTGI
jgi:AraC-like DNA-binding protein